MRNLHQLFDWQYIGQIIGGDFAKFCDLLRIYERFRLGAMLTKGKSFEGMTGQAVEPCLLKTVQISHG